MIRLISDSRSIIFQASHILLIRIDAVVAPAWAAQPEREAQVSVTVERVFKGAFDGEHSPLEIRVVQQRPQTAGFILPPRGCWYNTPLSPNRQFVVFSKTPASDPTSVLAEGKCFRLIAAESALIDIQMADELESTNVTFPEIVKDVKPYAASVHELFIDYLAQRFDELRLHEKANFEAALDLLRLPSLAPLARTTLLTSLINYLDSSRETTDWELNRFALALFQLLRLPEANYLQDDIIETYLPNWLGLSSGGFKLSASDVFRASPKELTDARRTLETYNGSSSTAELRKWLRGE